MKHLVKIATATAIFALAACGSDEGDKQANAKAEKAAAAEIAAPESEKSTASDMMETAKEVATEMVADVAKSVKLDASSLSAFKSSLGDMKASLSSDQASSLTSALASLAKGATTEKKGGLLGAAKDMAAGKSMEDTLYESLGSQLNGLSFEDIIKLAS